jgi:cell division protein FtsA
MAIQNLIKSVQRAGVEIDDLVLQPLASGAAVLTPEDKDRGVVLVDIGGGTTDIAVFIQGGIWHTSVIPIGGHHFTNDIVYVMHTPHHTADYLKLRYGSAIAEPAPNAADDLVEAETLTAGEKQQISRQLLNEILQARAEQIVELIYNEIQRSGYEGLLPAGVVLTGGSSQLPRLDELVRDMLGVPARIGVPTNLTGLAEAIDTPPYATSVGLLQWGARHGQSGTMIGMSERNGLGSVYDRFKNWLREFLP